MKSVIKPLAIACGLAFNGPALAASSITCTGNVTIGEGATQISTSIVNKPVGAQCLNDLIIDTVREGANYDNHGEFVVEVARLIGQWLRSHTISFKDGAEIMAAAAKSNVGKTVTVRVIGFNDFHGNLQSPGTFGVNLSVPPANRPAVGGAEFIAGHVAKLKSANPLNVVVGAGDFIGASPLISALFHDEPAIEIMNRVGLEFNAVGNHEFDHGSGELLRLQNGGCKPGDPNTCKGAAVGTPVPFEGAKFQWLSANVVNSAAGQPLLPAYGIKQFGKIRVAFIGMTLKETPTIVTPAGVAGLEFRDEADTVNALIPELRSKGAQAIVVLVHQGGFQTGGSQDINGCDGSLAGSPIQAIVNRLDNAVDAVISGHTHAAYNCQLPNVNNRLIPVTSASAFGRVLTSLDIVIDTRTRDVKETIATNSLISRADATVTPNTQIKSIVDGYNALVSPIANQVTGSITADLSSSAIDGACNMPAGDVIADAQLQATVPATFGSAVIAFMNRGGVRNPGFTFASSPAAEGNGNVTYGEAFTVQPFGNSLVTMTLTALDIKNVLEEQFAGCRGQSPTATRIMLPSAGFSYTWDGSKACDQRISNVKLTAGGLTEVLVDGNGTVLIPLKPYRVTVNNFMATGGDGYNTFLNGKDPLGGAQDIDALVAYLASFKAPNPPYDPGNPAFGKPRINRVSSSTVCPGGANTNP
ncbi:MAG: 5-nucleotidase [Betaproteobacteria bacterium]